MAGLLVNLLSLSFIPAIVLAKLPRSCVRDTNVLTCSNLRNFKNEDILSAVMYKVNIDFVYLSERTPYCFCKTMRLVQLLRVTDIIVFTHSSCNLHRFLRCGLKLPMPKSEVFGGLVVSASDPRRNWALNHHVLHLWNKVQGVRSEKIKSNFYAGILKDLKNEVKSLNKRAQEKLLAMRPKPIVTTLRRRRGRIGRRKVRRWRRRKGRRWRRRKVRRWRRRKRRRWRRRKRRRWRRRRWRRRRSVHWFKTRNRKFKALMKKWHENLKKLKKDKRRDFRPNFWLAKFLSEINKNKRKRRRGWREVGALQRPHSYESWFKLGIRYLRRLNSTRFETSFGNLSAFSKLTPIGKLKPVTIKQARKYFISELKFRHSPNPAAHSWSALGHQSPAPSQPSHSRMRRATIVYDPPTVSPYLAFVGGEFYSLFDQKGIRLALRKKMKPIGAEERLRAPRRNYPITRIGKRRPVKRNRKSKRLAAKLRSTRTASVASQGAVQNGDLTQAEIKSLAQDTDHRMKSFITFFVAITGIITIIVVILIVAMRSTGESPSEGGRRRRGMNPDDMCWQCKSRIRHNEKRMNQSEAEMWRRNPTYPSNVNQDPFCDPMPTQPDTNWNANSKLYRNHSPLVSFLKSITSEKGGVTREHDREMFNIKRCRQKCLNQPQVHRQPVPVSRLPDPRRLCRPVETTPPESKGERRVTCLDNGTR